MVANIKAIEVSGEIDEERQLHVDEPLPVSGPSRVRIIILMPDGEVDETEWLTAGATNPAFEFLSEPEEDIYTADDGKPFHD